MIDLYYTVDVHASSTKSQQSTIILMKLGSTWSQTHGYTGDGIRFFNVFDKMINETIALRLFFFRRNDGYNKVTYTFKRKRYVNRMTNVHATFPLSRLAPRFKSGKSWWLCQTVSNLVFTRGYPADRGFFFWTVKKNFYD
jgi:hypothetical protein